MMSSSDLSSNQERIVDALLANLHLIYFGTQVTDPTEQDDVAKRTIDIAIDQAGTDAVLGTIKVVAHKALRDNILRVVGI